VIVDEVFNLCSSEECLSSRNKVMSVVYKKTGDIGFGCVVR